jgi:hypothetical protein
MIAVVGAARRRTSGAPAAHGPRALRVALVVGALAVILALASAAWPPSASRGMPGAAATLGAAPAPAEFAALVGNWVRPDGGYELSVSGVAKDGTATVSYLNPKPIRVARAEARREGERVLLFVKLDDVNYPGSSYTLAYDPSNDTLGGDYFQAVQGAHYDVAFVRRR